MHFYIIFGTNLLTKGPMQIAVFFLFQCFAEKKYQTESKRNETFARIIFGTNAIQETWSGHQGSNDAAARQEGASRGRRAPTLMGPSQLHRPTCFVYLYSYTLKTSRGATKPVFHRRDLLYPWDPILGPFRRSARGGIDHVGLLHQHHCLSDEAWVVYHRPSVHSY